LVITQISAEKLLYELNDSCQCAYRPT